MTLVLVSMLGTLLVVASLSCLLCSSWARWTSWTSCSWWRTPGKLLDKWQLPRGGPQPSSSSSCGSVLLDSASCEPVFSVAASQQQILLGPLEDSLALAAAAGESELFVVYRAVST